MLTGALNRKASVLSNFLIKCSTTLILYLKIQYINEHLRVICLGRFRRDPEGVIHMQKEFYFVL